MLKNTHADFSDSPWLQHKKRNYNLVPILIYFIVQNSKSKEAHILCLHMRHSNINVCKPTFNRQSSKVKFVECITILILNIFQLNLTFNIVIFKKKLKIK